MAFDIEKEDVPPTLESVQLQLKKLKHELNNLRTAISALDDQVQELVEKAKDPPAT